MTEDKERELEEELYNLACHIHRISDKYVGLVISAYNCGDNSFCYVLGKDFSTIQAKEYRVVYRERDFEDLMEVTNGEKD